MNTTLLIAGALGGGGFVGVAFAFPRHTRRILARGLIVTALCYVYFAATAHAPPQRLAVELAGVALYAAMALRGLRGSPWWLVTGWGLHPAWDVALHLVGPDPAPGPIAFATACLTWDPLVAGAIAVGILVRARAVMAPGRPARTAPALARGIVA